MKNEKKVGRNAIYNVIKQGCGIVIPLIIYRYVTRALGADFFGRISFVDSVVGFFLAFSMLGIPTYAVREGARIREDKLRIKQFSDEVFVINCVSAVIALVLLLVLVLNVERFRVNKDLFAIYSISIIASLIGRDWINSVYEDFFYITARYVICHVLSLILILIFVNDKNDYLIYALLSVSAGAIALFFNVPYTSKKYIGYGISHLKMAKQHLKPILYLFFVSFTIRIYVNSDITLLGFLVEDKEVGIYSLASKVYLIIKGMINAITIVAVPRVSNYIGTGNYTSFKRSTRILKEVLLLISVPITVGVFCHSKSILYILGGDQFVSGYLALSILGIALVCAILGGFYANVILIPLRKDRLFAKITLISAATNIILNLFLIPVLGIVGTAVTTLIAEIIVLACCGFFSKEYDSWISKKVLICVALGCAVIITTSIALKSIFSSKVEVLILSVLISVFLYAIIIYSIKPVDWKNEIT